MPCYIARDSKLKTSSQLRSCQTSSQPECKLDVKDPWKCPLWWILYLACSRSFLIYGGARETIMFSMLRKGNKHSNLPMNCKCTETTKLCSLWTSSWTSSWTQKESCSSALSPQALLTSLSFPTRLPACDAARPSAPARLLESCQPGGRRVGYRDNMYVIDTSHRYCDKCRCYRTVVVVTEQLSW